MKIFISSLIRGFEEYRDAAGRVARELDHEVVRAEDFPASVGTPQQACLEGVRQSDLLLLLVFDRYGATQASGLRLLGNA